MRSRCDLRSFDSNAKTQVHAGGGGDMRRCDAGQSYDHATSCEESIASIPEAKSGLSTTVSQS